MTLKERYFQVQKDLQNLLQTSPENITQIFIQQGSLPVYQDIMCRNMLSKTGNEHSQTPSLKIIINMITKQDTNAKAISWKDPTPNSGWVCPLYPVIPFPSIYQTVLSGPISTF